MFRAGPLLFFVLFCFPSFADERGDGMLRITGYDTAGFVGDINATRLFSSLSILASSIQNHGENDVLLLLFINKGMIEKNRIAEFGLEAFSKEQANALAELEIDDKQCNLMRLDSDLAEEVHLLAIDTAIATELELQRCILLLLARTQGVDRQQLETFTNRELIVECIERL